MQFDSAQAYTGTEGTLQVRLQQLFTQKGFPIDSIPPVIYWNLNASYKNMPVDPHSKGVICLSGFSQGILKQFENLRSIQDLLNLSPFFFLRETLTSKRFLPIYNLAR